MLLIDDNVDANRALRALPELVGHAANAAFDGISGVDMALEGTHDVIVCDIGLPGRDEIEFARRLRQGTQGTAPMLIAASGYGQAEDRACAAASTSR